MFRKLCHLTVICAVVSLFGCGGGNDFADTVVVSGIVTMDGDPVPDARVTFIATGKGSGRGANGVTDKDGKYQLTTFNTNDGAMPGVYAITITQQDANDSDDSDLSDGEASGAAYEAEMDNAGSDAGMEIESKLPKKYADVATSGLERTVAESGKNEFNFELTAE